MLGSTDLFSSSVGHGLINLPLADVWNQRYPAILRDVPPSLRDAAIPHHCPATSAAHRARLVLTSTRVIGRNAQTAAIAESVGEQAKSDSLLPFLIGPVRKRMRQVRSFVGQRSGITVDFGGLTGDSDRSDGHAPKMNCNQNPAALASVI